MYIPGGTIPIIKPSPPVAWFTYAKINSSGRTFVSFTDGSSGVVDQYYWNFGDNTTSHQKNPLHEYRDPGTYGVSHQVKNSSGSSWQTRAVTIAPAYVAPVISFTFVVSGLGVQFTNTSTIVAPTTSYLWTFGDGTTSTEFSPYKAYSSAGDYTVYLMSGGWSTSQRVSVANGIILVWQDNSSNETAFSIDHSLNGSDWTTIETVGAGVTTKTITWNDHAVNPGVTNYFRVYASNGAGDSGYTNTVETLCGG